MTYTYYTYLVVGYGWDETYARTGGVNTTGPGVSLAPGEEWARSWLTAAIPMDNPYRSCELTCLLPGQPVGPDGVAGHE